MIIPKLLTPEPVDLLIIGGGINGTGIAADAAGRGLSVLLCEQNDLASGTSSASSKLIHGGLRYLEHYEFRLVREALTEREVLLAKAPHIIRPLEFVLPHAKHLRPALLIRLGLFLYDHLAKRKKLPGSQSLKFANDARGIPLQSHLRKGFSYADCWVDDARLVILNAIDARENGAQIFTRTRCESVHRVKWYWEAKLYNQTTQQYEIAQAKVLINASGPWVSQVLSKIIKIEPQHATILSKGSHIIVPRLYEGEHAYILQNRDGRIVFVIPYENAFTLIGTTDENFTGDPSAVAIDDKEKKYLCASVANYFKNPPTLTDIIHSYAGVRPLLYDGANNLSSVTRDYLLELHEKQSAAPLLNVVGGKITTYRRLAEAAMSKLQHYFPYADPPWTANKPLTGGDLPQQDFVQFYTQFTQAYPWLPEFLAKRLAHNYGTRVAQILGLAQSIADLGEDFGDGLYEAEVNYLTHEEWAVTADDILWRRSKLGLHCSKNTMEKLRLWLGK